MLLEGLLEIAQTLWQHKLRTFLTALSVAWGTFMLSLLLGLGQGLRTGAQWEFRDNAVNSLWFFNSTTSLSYRGRGPGRSVYFNNEDLDVLGRRLPEVQYRSGRYYFWGEFFVSYGAKHASFDIRGVHPEHRYIARTQMLQGRFVNDIDLREHRKVAVIGSKVRESLFEKEDPIGKQIQIRGLTYQVVGEFADEGGEAELRRIYVPLTTTQLVYNQPNIIHNLILTLKSDDLAESSRVAQQARAILGDRHDVAPEDRRAIRVQNNLEQFAKTMNIFVWLGVFVWIVGAGTLLAGVVSVSNIMLISVRERTKEIGIRKALGATPRSIVGLIVTEAMLLTSVSGYLGLFGGVFLIEAIADRTQGVPFMRQPHVDLRSVLIGAGLLVVAGALSGLFPALKAARVDPIVALREGDT
ncbi:MAG TPA: ABC transporter permease [Polyangiaceae bacterium]|nr:ABC transporter permease [Polyangiaceae bacterium]